MKFKIMCGDSLERLKDLPDNSVDSLVTDPPAGIAFMGKGWDDFNDTKTTKSQVVTGMNAGVSFKKSIKNRQNFINSMTNIFSECLRVMKPGAYGLVWSLPRTSHWTAMALEDAGFEIRDKVIHIFGSGFPKSHNIGKACDRTDLEGFGTALKPAHEDWILIRKPIEESTIAKQVLATGTGGLNIDAARIGCNDKTPFPVGEYGDTNFRPAKRTEDKNVSGRFPANLVFTCSCEEGHGETTYIAKNDEQIGKSLDTQERGYGYKKIIRNNISDTATKHQPDCVCAELDKQSGSKCGQNGKVTGKEPSHSKKEHNTYGDFSMTEGKSAEPKDSLGGASRFFYCAKISTSERNIGLDDQSDKQSTDLKPIEKRFTTVCKNNHPTVKPMKLMSYFIKLITPPGGTVLDPFMGSGSTLLACKVSGFNGIGIEKEKEYVKIAKLRIKGVKK